MPKAPLVNITKQIQIYREFQDEIFSKSGDVKSLKNIIFDKLHHHPDLKCMSKKSIQISIRRNKRKILNLNLFKNNPLRKKNGISNSELQSSVFDGTSFSSPSKQCKNDLNSSKVEMSCEDCNELNEDLIINTSASFDSPFKKN